jgi:hypothetical protein
MFQSRAFGEVIDQLVEFGLYGEKKPYPRPFLWLKDRRVE